MTPEYDTSDPLGALMADWRATGSWFWFGMAVAAGLTFVKPEFAWIVALSSIGMPVVQLGQTVVIVGNELRKSQRGRPTKSDEPR
ncbi:MAG: hypothetical protein O2816_14895 [Planctomycetota bacterium]|nr:hypothetical protein [Planctomycetota bacterium]